MRKRSSVRTVLCLSFLTALLLPGLGRAQCTTGNFTDNGSSASYNLSSAQTLVIASGTFTGTVNFNGGGTICVATGATFKGGMNNAGTGASLNVYGTADFSNSVSFGGGFTLNVQANGAVYFRNNPNQNGAVSINVATGAHLQFDQAFTLQNNSVLSNNGSVLAKADFSSNSGTLVTNNQRFRTVGNFNPGGRVNNYGMVIATGFININAGDKTVNYCRFVSESGFNNNDPDTDNRGLIWVTKTPTGSDNFVWQNNAALINSGYVRTKSFINGSPISNAGGTIVVEGAASGTYSKNQGSISGGLIGDRSNSGNTLDVNIGTISATYQNIALLDTTADQFVNNCSGTYSSYTVSGNVWIDANRNAVKDASESYYAGGSLYALLVNSAGNVLATTAVSTASGAYTLGSIPPGTVGLRVIISTAAGTVGATAPAAAAPAGYSLATENNGGSAETSGDGSMTLAATTANLAGRHFGIVLPTYSVSGTVYEDRNGLQDNRINGSGSNGGGPLYVNVVSGASVLASATVSANGDYMVAGIPAGSYQLVLSSSATATSPGLPAGYGHTGEGTGTTADGSIDGTISLTVSAAATDRNFGIKKMLQAHNKAYVMSSSATTAINLPSSANGALRYRYLVAPAGTASSGNTPGAPTGTDPYTGTGATASDVLVIDPASYSGARNGNPVAGALVLRYKGVQLQAGGCAGTDAGGISCSLYNSATGKWEIAQFDAAQLEILVTEGVSSVGFAYAWKDAAGLISESAGYTVSFGGVLPLKLGAFTAEASAAGVLLRWNTLEEEGTDRFEVEYSTDGRAFRPAGSVAAAGTAASYRFTHRPATAGTHFYRLRMIDADGQFTWSPVRFVSDRAAAAAFTLSPNPATGSTVRLLWSGAAAQVRVTDALGRPVFATALAPGSPLGLPAGRWARGTYFVIVEGSGARYTQTLLVP